MTGRLDGQVAIVTGGGRGFGRAIAMRFAAEGASVLLTARSQAEIDRTVAEIAAQGGRAQGTTGDVSSRADVDRVLGVAEQCFGPVTLMVNNAALSGPVGRLDGVNVEEWWGAFSVNFLGPVHYMQAVVPGMRERKSGRIINVVSQSALVARQFLSAYNTSKWALMRLNEIVALETAKDGIGVFAVEPGRVMTEVAKATLPLMRAADPEGVAFFQEATKDEDPELVLAACARRCADLAAGPYLPLSGHFLKPEDSLDELLAQVTSQRSIQAGGPS